MNIRAIRALLKKDFNLFLSNRFYLLITIVGLVFYIAVYFVLPSRIDSTLKLALYAPVLPPAFALDGAETVKGLEIKQFENADDCRQAVQAGQYPAAIILPSDIMEIWAGGGKPEITIFYSPDTLPEMRRTIVTLVEELCFVQTGQGLNYVASTEVLGTDLMGSQIALRDRLRPLLATVILLVEILTLASLISTEIEQGTARALMITPTRIRDLMIAKGLLGVGLAFGQAILFILIAGGLLRQPGIVLTTLLLGSLLIVAAAFLLASLARDVNAVTSWGILVLIILIIPGTGILVPGLLSGWAKIIPSFYLTDTLNRVINYGSGWQDIYLNLIILAVLTVLLAWGGMAALRRRYR